MATLSPSPELPSPAKTRAELSWFKERRKRWENAPRNRVVPVSSVGSPIKRLTSGDSPAVTRHKPIPDSKPVLKFGAQKQSDESSLAVKAQLGISSKFALTRINDSSASTEGAQKNKGLFGSMSRPVSTTSPAGSSLFGIPPKALTSTTNAATSIFGGTSTPTNQFGAKPTTSEQIGQPNSSTANLSSSSSMSKPLFGSAFGGGTFGFGSESRKDGSTSNPFGASSDGGSTQSPLAFTSSSQATSSKDKPLFGTSSSSEGLFGAIPRNKGANPFAISREAALTTETTTPASSSTVAKTTPVLGAFSSMAGNGNAGGSIVAHGAAEPSKDRSSESEPTAQSEQAKPSSERSHKDRLIEFYKKYNPDKLGKVDETLASYKGKEDELFRKLEDKYVTNTSKFPLPSGEGPTCFLDFSIGDNQTTGRVTVKLYEDKAPLACENFRSLCTGEKGIGKSGKPLCYKNSTVHRVVPQFCVQLGDFTKANGTGGESIYPPNSEYGDMWGKFKDEIFLQHSKKGLISMANNGANRNSSQFFFTLKAIPHLDGKHVVFGEVVDGIDIVDMIASIPTDSKQFPKETILVDNCGELRDGKEVSAAVTANKTTPFGGFQGNQASSSSPFGSSASNQNTSSSPFSSFSTIKGAAFGSAATPQNTSKTSPFASFSSTAAKETATPFAGFGSTNPKNASPFAIVSGGSNNSKSPFGGVSGSSSSAGQFGSFSGSSVGSSPFSFGPPRK